MYELKKIGKVFTSKFVGTGPSPYTKRIYRAAVLQMLRNTAVVGGPEGVKRHWAVHFSLNVKVRECELDFSGLKYGPVLGSFCVANFGPRIL